MPAISTQHCILTAGACYVVPVKLTVPRFFASWPFYILTMSDIAGPSTSNANGKRRISLSHSEPVKKTRTSSSSNDELNEIEFYLDYKLFKADEEGSDSERAQKTSQALKKFFTVADAQLSEETIKKVFFRDVLKAVEHIKTKVPNIITKTGSVESCLDNFTQKIKEETNEKNAKELVKELLRELTYFSFCQDPCATKLEKAQVCRLKKISRALDKLLKETRKVEASEISMDQLGVSQNPASQMHRLQRRILVLWQEREKILARGSEYTGSLLFRQLTYKNEKLPAELNQAVSNFFNKHIAEVKQFRKRNQRTKHKRKLDVPCLSIVELKKSLKDAGQKSGHADFNIDDALVTEIFTYLVEDQKNMRSFEFNELINRYVLEERFKPETMPEETEETQKECKSHEQQAEKKFKKIKEEFDEKGKDIVVESEGFDVEILDDDEEDEDEDEEEEEEEDDPVETLDDICNEFDRDDEDDQHINSTN